MTIINRTCLFLVKNKGFAEVTYYNLTKRIELHRVSDNVIYLILYEEDCHQLRRKNSTIYKLQRASK